MTIYEKSFLSHQIGLADEWKKTHALVKPLYESHTKSFIYTCLVLHMSSFTCHCDAKLMLASPSDCANLSKLYHVYIEAWPWHRTICDIAAAVRSRNPLLSAVCRLLKFMHQATLGGVTVSCFSLVHHVLSKVLDYSQKQWSPLHLPPICWVCWWGTIRNYSGAIRC